MRQSTRVIHVATPGRGLVEISDEIAAFVADSGIATGLLTLFCRHTSASLLIQERVFQKAAIMTTANAAKGKEAILRRLRIILVPKEKSAPRVELYFLSPMNNDHPRHQG